MIKITQKWAFILCPFVLSAPIFSKEITFIARPFSNATMTWDEFLERIEQKALDEDFVLFRGRKTITHKAYHRFAKEKREDLNQEGALVVLKDKIIGNIRFSELGGVSIDTNSAFLNFDIRYLETLHHIGEGGNLYAMCVLPRYNKCILLGYPAFDPSLPPVPREFKPPYRPKPKTGRIKQHSSNPPYPSPTQKPPHELPTLMKPSTKQPQPTLPPTYSIPLLDKDLPTIMPKQTTPNPPPPQTNTKPPTDSKLPTIMPPPQKQNT
ncbi:hypothetical protein CCZ01_09565 [Helicobacter monodelphidis]|uniref:hypothetical protein n=1 Tax=Helicobacter sp. 15-1451 TaxID=2004995 RepID=UPI000DCE74B2|nr:hypothetical protein [Helicobacter sp. 15-1451]RAX56426.1 hypothetical protein CCZ01_09565 [Helicobacter sp. 15-1451]